MGSQIDQVREVERRHGVFDWRAILVLIVAAAFAFMPVIRNGFVDFDDDQNFLRNNDFRGLSWSHIRWALTTDLVGVYQPLGWIFLEMQWSLWGLDPRGYHLTSVFMHVINGILLYALCVALLRRCGGVRAKWEDLALASILASVLFVSHPLRTECVAWASCQTFLPCASFLMLSVLSYLKASESSDRARIGWLATSCLMYSASLGCKGVAIGLPIVLVLLDIYPIRRLSTGSGLVSAAVWAEKVPFVFLSLAFLFRGVIAKRMHNALEPVPHEGVGSRIAQACYGICFYPAKTLYPSGLSAFYALPTRVSLRDTTFLVCAMVVAALTVVSILLRRRWPGLLIAWLSYLILLAPNLGLVRIGRLLAADRYSYVASLPGAVLTAYLLARLLAGPPWRRWAVVASAVAIILLLSAASWRQCGTWKNSSSLWAQAVSQGGQGDHSLRTYLGIALAREGRVDEAITQFSEAVRLQPREPESRVNLAMALAQRGRPDGAIAQLTEAVQLRPGYADARIKLGTALAQQGRLAEARNQLAEASRLSSGDPNARNNLGIALGRMGRFDEALAEFAEAVRLRPSDPRFRHNLDNAKRDAMKAGQIPRL